jgi:hypothetical protein
VQLVRAATPSHLLTWYPKHSLLSLHLLAPNKLFYSFWITPRRGQVLSASARHRPADVWALASALTSHSGLHYDPLVSQKLSSGCFYCTPMENFLTGFFCYLTFSKLENMSYGRIVHRRRMDLWHVKSCRDENKVLAGTHRGRKNERGYGCTKNA